MTLYQGFQAIGIALFTLALLGCGNNGEDVALDADDTGQGAIEAPVTADEQAPGPEIEVMSEPVEIDVGVDLDERRQMQVSGSTNLPEETRLRIVVERESSRVSWRLSTTASGDGSFAAGPFGPGSGLPDGIYLIQITAPPANVQPLTVRERIGEYGEHLSGEWVQETVHGLGNQVRYRARVELVDQRTIRAIEGG